MEKVKKKKQSGSGSLRSILVHADFIDKCLMAVGFLGAALDGLSTPVVFFYTAQVMNDMGAASTSGYTFPLNRINQRCLILLYVAIGILIFAFLEGYCWTRAADRLAAKMRANYLKAVLRQDIEYFDLNLTSTSDVITTVTSDTIVIQDFLGEKLPNLLIRLFMFGGCYIAAFMMLWRLAIVAAPFYVLLIVPGMVCGKKLMGIAKNVRVEYNKAGNIVEQAVGSIRTVYASAGEKRTIFEFGTALKGTLELGLRQGLIKGLGVGSGGMNYLLWAFTAYYGSRMVMYHGAKGGTVYCVIAVLGIGGGAFGLALSNLTCFSEASSAGKRILQMINRVPEIDPNNAKGHIPQSLDGNIEFKHVVFAYPSRPENIIFKDFCLTIPARKTVALVGESGSGKSTVVSLLQRFYNPRGGEILLDGVVIDKLQIKWLRSQMGLVSQEPALFATSIRENILFGKQDATMDEVVEAAKASNAHNFITKLPLGYETQVGERGVQMSGGQKQRIAIARAIIRSPRIILFDEATSALDSESERIVQQALDRASVGRTTVTIAHRLSTIRNADMIAVVQKGQVMETGSHEELTQNSNSYYNSLLGHQETQKDRLESDETGMIMTPYPESDICLNNPIPCSNDESTMSEKSGIKDEKFAAPSFRRLLALNSPEWKQGIAGCLSAALVGAIQPVVAFELGSLISVFFLKDHEELKRQIRTFTFYFIGLSIFSVLINLSQHCNFTYMGENLTKRVREKMLSKILTFEVGWFDRDENSSGAICSRFAKDANVVRSLVGDRMALLIVAGSATMIAFTMSLIIAWRLALVMIAVQPLIIAVIYARRVLLQNLSQKSIKSQDGSSKLAAEAVSNYRTVTAFSLQVRFDEMFEQSQQGMVRENIKQSWYAGLVLGFAQFITKCIWALVFWYGGKLMSDGYITSREFFETFLILVITGFMIADAGSTTTDIAKGSDAVASLFAILDRETTIQPDNPQGIRPESIEGEIEFINIDFAYPTRPEAIILQDFSFKIEAGKSTALVGPSGSGKSTLIGLIERFYDPIRGTVKIDGRDIRSYHLRSLREHIALVSQEPPLFAGTIRENIVYGVSNEVGEAEIIEAAKSANAHEFIVGLEDGYDTHCGDRGVQLSGGQKQRVAIARAVLRNPRLLLLDEATSALDSQSEKVVHEALERLMVQRRRTSIVVAHRLSTIRNCDTIAVLDKGKVVETGNHASLVAKGPTSVYYSLLNLQSASDSSSTVLE